MQMVNIRRILNIARKEIIFALRDIDQLMILLILPFLIYPVIAVVSFTAASQSRQVVDQATVKAVLPLELERFKNHIATDSMQISFVADPMQQREDLKQLKIHALVEVASVAADFFSAGSVETALFRVHYDKTSWKSKKAVELLAEAFDKIGDQLATSRLQDRNLPNTFLYPLKFSRKSIASPEKEGGDLLGKILPGLMIMFAVMGAFMTSLDITSGERDRGTLETLLLTPVPTVEIMLGKLTAIVTNVLISVTVNVGCQGLLAYILSRHMPAGGDYGISLSISASALLKIFVMMIPFAACLAVLFMTVALMAGTTKRAQMYLSPMMGLIILPSFVGMLDGFDLSTFTAAIPVVNLTLTFKALAMETCSWALYLQTLAFSCFHCFLAALLASSVYRSEDILVSESGTLADLLYPAAPGQTAPTARAAVYMFGLAFFLLTGVSPFFLNSEHFSNITGLGITQILFYLLPPLIYLWFYRYRIIESLDLELKKIRLENFVLIPVMTLCILVFILQFGIWQASVLPEAKELTSMFAGLFDSAPFWWIILIMSPLAGICEEVLFRGFIQKGLRTRLGPWAAIIMAAMMFGFAHISPAKIITTFMIGLWMGYIYQITGSLWMSIATHAFNNALAGSAMYFAFKMKITPSSAAAVTDPAVLPAMPLQLLIFAALVLAVMLPRFISVNKPSE